MSAPASDLSQRIRHRTRALIGVELTDAAGVIGGAGGAGAGSGLSGEVAAEGTLVRTESTPAATFSRRPTVIASQRAAVLRPIRARRSASSAPQPHTSAATSGRRDRFVTSVALCHVRASMESLLAAAAEYDPGGAIPQEQLSGRA